MHARVECADVRSPAIISNSFTRETHSHANARRAAFEVFFPLGSLALLQAAIHDARIRVSFFHSS